MKYKTLGMTDQDDGVLLKCSKMSSLEEIRQTLQPFYEDLVDYYENDLLLTNNPDYRTGQDSYAYESLEIIKGNLSYFADRWRCCFRIRWLIDLINPDYVLWGGQNDN